jgi:hypothetical protein
MGACSAEDLFEKLVAGKDITGSNRRRPRSNKKISTSGYNRNSSSNNTKTPHESARKPALFGDELDASDSYEYEGSNNNRSGHTTAADGRGGSSSISNNSSNLEELASSLKQMHKQFVQLTSSMQTLQKGMLRCQDEMMQLMAGADGNILPL